MKEEASSMQALARFLTNSMSTQWIAGRLLLMMLVASLVLSCRHTPTVSGQGAPDSRTREVESTLVEFSAALAHGDAEAVRNLTAPRFTLLDEGHVYDVESTIESIRAVLSTGSMVRVAEGFDTQIRGNIAWSHYSVSGQFQDAKGSTPLSFLEAAVLEQSNGRWRLVMLTTIPGTDQ